MIEVVIPNAKKYELSNNLHFYCSLQLSNVIFEAHQLTNQFHTAFDSFYTILKLQDFVDR